MKIIYLWIKTYEHIKNRGYLFHAGYTADYDEGTNSLTIQKTDNIESLLYGDRISVTAIVGDNGAGKSTLLDAVRTILFDSRSWDKSIEGFLVWEDKGQLNLFPFMKKTPDAPNNISVHKTLPDNFNLIYYSDFLDIKYYLNEFDDEEDVYTYIDEYHDSFRNRYSIQINISTAYLLRKNSSNMLDFFHSDTRRQIDFYGSPQGKSLPFPAPANLSVKIEFLGIDIFDNVLDAPLQAYEYMGMGHHGEINTKAYIIGLLTEMETIYQNKTIPNDKPLEVLEILQWDIFVVYLYHLLSMRREEHPETNDYSQVDEIIKIVFSAVLDDFDLWNELEKTFSQTWTDEENFETYLSFYLKTLQALESPKYGNFNVAFSIPDHMMHILCDNIRLKYNASDWRVLNNTAIQALLRFPDEYMARCGWNGNWSVDTFMNFYDNYLKIACHIDFLKCSWGLSSGENSMFNLFARLHEALQVEEKENIILIFDELDSSFHPQWQQKIIRSLTEFLRKGYPNKEFQLILTTHSPVLLSDIPETNVLFLRKDSVETDHEQTFAANIANLYYDSFFMDKGSIGETARGSIIHFMDAVLELEKEGNKNEPNQGRAQRLLNRFLNKQYPNMGNHDKKSEDECRTLLQLFVDSIGEDIWRYKANERYHQYLDMGKDKKAKLQDDLTEFAREQGKDSVITLLKEWLEKENL